MPSDTFRNLPEDKRRRIVDAAIEEFAERSYRDASINRIVARAGISKGSLYQYFDDKLGLYRYLVTEVLVARKMARLQADRPRAAGLFEELVQAFHSGFALHLEDPRLGRMASSLMEPLVDPELRPFFGETRRMGHDWMVDRLRRAQQEGEIAADVDLGLAAHLLSRALNAGLMDALLDALDTDLAGLMRDPSVAQRISEADLDRLLRAGVRLALYGLAPREAR